LPALKDFHDVRFPARISFGATGGPVLRNEIITLASGLEKRNARQSRSKRRFDVGTGIRSVDDLKAVIAFFEARRGSLYGFRFRDPFDWSSAAGGKAISPLDQQIAIGDGTVSAFQLKKSYGDSGGSASRDITRPVLGTVRIAVDGTEASEGSAFTVDYTTGQVMFEPAYVPQAGVEVTAGFEFDIPVRFDADSIEISMASFTAGHIPAIPLVELLP
jgi:uncharacterized protein (TIGR02217 family)